MIKVIDISWCQSTANIDWQKLHDLGVGVIIRAGQSNFTDSLFLEHWANAQKFAVPAGVYYFFQPNMPAAPQLAHFLEIYKILYVKPKLIFLDVENIAYTEDQKQADGTIKKVYINILPPNATWHSGQLWEWLTGVRQATGVTPGIYTRADYFDAWTLPSYAWNTWPLWIASWTNYSASVRLPKAWTAWQFWQYQGGTGRQEGVTGPTDLDYFNGTLDDLKALCGINPVIPPVIPPVVPPPAPELTDKQKLDILWAERASKQFLPIMGKP